MGFYLLVIPSMMAKNDLSPGVDAGETGSGEGSAAEGARAGKEAVSSGAPSLLLM